MVTHCVADGKETILCILRVFYWVSQRENLYRNCYNNDVCLLSNGSLQANLFRHVLHTHDRVDNQIRDLNP